MEMANLYYAAMRTLADLECSGQITPRRAAAVWRMLVRNYQSYNEAFIPVAHHRVNRDALIGEAYMGL